LGLWVQLIIFVFSFSLCGAFFSQTNLNISPITIFLTSFFSCFAIYDILGIVVNCKKVKNLGLWRTFTSTNIKRIRKYTPFGWI
jgi:hypothetical protein